MRACEHVRSDTDLLACTRVDAEAFGVFYRRYERPNRGTMGFAFAGWATVDDAPAVAMPACSAARGSQAAARTDADTGW
jgi:hypothetical protein